MNTDSMVKVSVSPILSHAEIDALACPAGTAAGQRCSDPEILVSSPWREGEPLAARQAAWRAREMATATRMVAILGDREGWTTEQRDAALSVALDIPTSAVKRGRSYPVDAVAVYRAAAQRVLP
jgi:hypothetical protein